MSENKKMIGVVQTVTIFESEAETFDRMKQWSTSQAKMAYERSRSGAIITIVLDEEGREVGRNVVGSPSAEALKMAEEWLEEEEENPPIVRAAV